MNNIEFLEVICCPETKQSIHYADITLVRSINSKIEEKQLRNRVGDIVEEKIDGGLIRDDGLVLYPIRSDIPILIIENSINLKS